MLYLSGARTWASRLTLAGVNWQLPVYPLPTKARATVLSLVGRFSSIQPRLGLLTCGVECLNDWRLSLPVRRRLRQHRKRLVRDLTNLPCAVLRIPRWFRLAAWMLQKRQNPRRLLLRVALIRRLTRRKPGSFYAGANDFVILQEITTLDNLFFNISRPSVTKSSNPSVDTAKLRAIPSGFLLNT